MKHFKLIIIGAGLSGLAAGLRYSRTGESTLILERHRIPGGLNSYYSRKGLLLETGLHAITNYATKENRSAPLTRLLRQLKIKHKEFDMYPHRYSQIVFPETTLRFSNESAFFISEISEQFPSQVDGFTKLVAAIQAFDAFTPGPYISARAQLATYITDPLLIEMLLCPIQFYGGYEEDDLDWAQFTIMYDALFHEGFFRCSGGIKWLLDRLQQGFQEQGGELRFNAGVQKIITKDTKVCGVILDNGEEITCDNLISTAGTPNTMELLGEIDAQKQEDTSGKLGYVESLFIYEPDTTFTPEAAITFFNDSPLFNYRNPSDYVDYRSGVICFPGNFQGYTPERGQLRITHLANYDKWKALSKEDYTAQKETLKTKTLSATKHIVGNTPAQPFFHDSFTPLTVERYTGKRRGSIYGSPLKNRPGTTRYDNCFIAGTDQGYLGIVGAMLSGLTMVNHHLLT